MSHWENCNVKRLSNLHQTYFSRLMNSQLGRTHRYASQFPIMKCIIRVNTQRKFSLAEERLCAACLTIKNKITTHVIEVIDFMTARLIHSFHSINFLFLFYFFSVRFLPFVRKIYIFMKRRRN
jgi:hypothetical protein